MNDVRHFAQKNSAMSKIPKTYQEKKIDWVSQMAKPITVFVGNFGSGKTETALNYAIAMAHAGARVQLVDLDIVNAYFRSREVRDTMHTRGVEIIAPTGEHAVADLPILLRDVGGALLNHNYQTDETRKDTKHQLVLDVGGDDLGARVLGGFADYLKTDHTEILQVVNTQRPFTDSLSRCRKMYDELEAASKLKIQGLVANTHLIHQTNLEVIQKGLQLTEQMAKDLGILLKFVAVEQGLLKNMDAAKWRFPILPLERFMTAPWEPSMHRGPIGRPGPMRLPDGVD